MCMSIYRDADNVPLPVPVNLEGRIAVKFAGLSRASCSDIRCPIEILRNVMGLGAPIRHHLYTFVRS